VRPLPNDWAPIRDHRTHCPWSGVRNVSRVSTSSARDVHCLRHFTDNLQSSPQEGGTPGYIRESLEQDIKNLQGLKNSLDAKRLASLAKRIYSARKIVVIAGDLATYLANYLEYQISLVGLPVFAATCGGRIMHMMRNVNKQDLVIAISFRRGLRQTVEGAQMAKARGAYCVALRTRIFRL